jgi:hypothetical protein
MAISSVTSAMNTALSSINRVSQRVEEIASHVAAGVESETGVESHLINSGILDLPLLKQQVVANVKVFETAESLLSTLMIKQRRYSSANSSVRSDFSILSSAIKCPNLRTSTTSSR